MCLSYLNRGLGEHRENQLKTNRESRDKLPADNERAGVAGADQSCQKMPCKRVVWRAELDQSMRGTGSRRHPTGWLCQSPNPSLAPREMLQGKSRKHQDGTHQGNVKCKS